MRTGQKKKPLVDLGSLVEQGGQGREDCQGRQQQLLGSLCGSEVGVAAAAARKLTEQGRQQQLGWQQQQLLGS